MNKKVIILMAAFMFVASGVYADHHKGSGMEDGDWEAKRAEHMQKKMDKMTEKLNLTEDQQSQIKAIMDEKWKAKKAIKAEMKEKMEALRDGKRAKIRALLNDDQKAAYKEMKEEHHGSMKGSYKGSHKGSEKGSKKGSKKGS